MKPGILLCIGTEKGLFVLQHLVKHYEDIQFHVCTFKETDVITSYETQIQEVARQAELPIYSWGQLKQAGESFLLDNNIGMILCVSWPYLIPEAMVRAVDGNTVVVHESLLPKYRGYAPLVTALINGEPEVGVTVMFAADDMHAGDIIYQKTVSVSEHDRISDLIAKVMPAYRDGMVYALDNFLKGKLEGTPQDHSEATYSIWRDEHDMFIDWTQPAKFIERFIRALGDPYLAARSYLGNDIVTIHEAVAEPDVPFEIRQPGKVWRLTQKGEPEVVCGQGILRLVDVRKDGLNYLPLTKLRRRFMSPYKQDIL